MKRLFLTISLLVMGIVVFGARPIKVKSGNTDFLKEQEVAVVEFDYSNTTWEKDETYKDFCGEDYEERVNFSIESFVRVFNENSKNLQVAAEAENAKYKVLFHIADLERKASGWGWGNAYIRVYGTIEIIEQATNTVVCEIEINALGGNANFSPLMRIGNCFESVGEELAKLK